MSLDSHFSILVCQIVLCVCSFNLNKYLYLSSSREYTRSCRNLLEHSTNIRNNALSLCETCGEKTPVSGLERGPACHPERSEGSGSPNGEILRCAQDDRHDLQMSAPVLRALLSFRKGGIIICISL